MVRFSQSRAWRKTRFCPVSRQRRCRSWRAAESKRIQFVPQIVDNFDVIKASDLRSIGILGLSFGPVHFSSSYIIAGKKQNLRVGAGWRFARRLRRGHDQQSRARLGPSRQVIEIVVLREIRRLRSDLLPPWAQTAAPPRPRSSWRGLRAARDSRRWVDDRATKRTERKAIRQQSSELLHKRKLMGAAGISTVKS